MTIGRILEPPTASHPGLISAEDGDRYRFLLSEWKESSIPSRGNVVNFEIDDNGQALAVYLDPSHGSTSATFSSKSNVAAALLAFFLGALGIHKFYLGYGTQGVILLIATIVGIATAFFGIGLLVLLVVWVICFVEFIIYLTKSDEEFHRIYVENRKPWF